MNHFRIRRLFPSFFILGVSLLMTGLATAYINGGFVIFSTAFVLSGAIFLFVSFSAASDSLKKSFDGFRYQKQSLRSLLLTLAVFILICILNYAAASKNIRFDLTHTGQHTLTEATKNILKNLNLPVEITVFYVGVAPNYIEDLLTEFQKLSPRHISTRIVDPLVEIGFAAQFGSVIKGDEKKVIVRSDKERKDIDFTKEPLSEETLINAILKTTREERKVYFLTGHSEYDIDDKSAIGLSTLKGLLEQNNSVSNELTLGLIPEIPEACDVLIIAGPKEPLNKADEETVQRYLEKGGKAVFFIESFPMGDKDHPLSKEDKLKNPTLNNILNRWGIIVGDDVVVDMENYIGRDVGCPATKNYPPHKEIVNNLDYTFYIRPRSIRLDHALAPGVNLAPLVKTISEKKSWAEKNQTLEVKFNEWEDTPGPVTLAAVIWGPKNEKRKADSKIIVFGDADFITNNFIDQFSNAQLALNAIGWISELENMIVYGKKTAEVQRLDLTNRQFRTIIVILLIMPLIIGCWGCLVWWRQAS